MQGGHGPPPNLAPNKFQERPTGASRMQENLLAAGAPSHAQLGSLQRSPMGLPNGREGRRGLVAPPQEPLPALGPLGLAPDPKSEVWPLPT